jgi:hypothetical protein
MLQGYCCAAGTVCARRSPTSWLCTPAFQTPPSAGPDTQLQQMQQQSTVTAAAASGDVSPAAAAASVDVLLLSLVPPVAANCSAVRLSATLLRNGDSPVPGARIFFTATTAGGKASSPVTATVYANTNTGGTATARLPGSVCGSAGAFTVVSAYTAAARAMGVRGPVSVQSREATVKWV